MMHMPLGGPVLENRVQEDVMPPVSHQTIKLSRGRHSSPEHGACVMELASMLAGEGFSDHPRKFGPFDAQRRVVSHYDPQ